MKCSQHTTRGETAALVFHEKNKCRRSDDDRRGVLQQDVINEGRQQMKIDCCMVVDRQHHGSTYRTAAPRIRWTCDDEQHHD